MTLLLYGLLAIVLAAVLFVVAAYVLPAGERIAPPVRDEPIWELPASRSLGPDDIATVRLPVALRGYRFAETDALLDRLGDELKARDAEIARLRGTSGEFPESDEVADDVPDDVPQDMPDDAPREVTAEASAVAEPADPDEH